MATFLFIVIIAILSFVAGRASAPSLPKRDKRGRFVKRKKTRIVMPTVAEVRAWLPTPGPQHAAVIGAVALGIVLALTVPPALAPFVALAPLPLGVALGVDIITPKKSNQSWAHLPLSAAWDPTDIMWAEWHE